MPVDNNTEPKQPRRFTQANQIRRFPTLSKVYEVRDVQSRAHKGLVLRVQPTGTKSWWFVYKRGTKRYRISIGEYPRVELAMARKKADEWRVMLQDESQPDPHVVVEEQKRIKAEQDTQEAIEVLQGEWTVKKLGATFLEVLTEARRRPRTISETGRHLEAHIYPVIGGKPAHEITWSDIEQVLAHASTRSRAGDGAALAQRNAVRTTLSGLFSWATGTRKPALSASVALSPPKHMRGMVNPVLHTQPAEAPAKKKRALRPDELKAIWSALQGDQQPAADALALIMLTGCRVDETARAEWRHVDLDAEQPTWTIPASVAKNKREHVVLLPPQAVDRLQAIKSDQAGFLFPNPNAMGGHVRYERLNRTLAQIVKVAGLDSVITPHYFRHSVAVFAEESTGSPPVRRRVMNHKSTDKMEGVYFHADYDDKARDVWAAWGRKLDALLDSDRNAVELGRREARS